MAVSFEVNIKPLFSNVVRDAMNDGATSISNPDFPKDPQKRPRVRDIHRRPVQPAKNPDKDAFYDCGGSGDQNCRINYYMGDAFEAGPFDLWEYEQVKARADRILIEVATGNMPPPESGYPRWPLKDVELFAKWIDDGCLP